MHDTSDCCVVHCCEIVDGRLRSHVYSLGAGIAEVLGVRHTGLFT